MSPGFPKCGESARSRLSMDGIAFIQFSRPSGPLGGGEGDDGLQLFMQSMSFLQLSGL